MRFSNRWMLLSLCLIAVLAFPAAAQDDLFGGLGLPMGDPFKVRVEMQEGDGSTRQLQVHFTIPENHFLYADQLKITGGDGVQLTPDQIPEAKMKMDPFEGKEVGVFDKDVAFSYQVRGQLSEVPVTVAWQGCTDQICFPPTSKTFMVAAGKSLTADDAARTDALPGEAAEPEDLRPAPQNWKGLADRYEIVDVKSGIIKPEPMVEILQAARSGQAGRDPGIAGMLGEAGIVFQILLILLGGFLLNLTPCVLPLIPINLAIIGAGAQSESKARGFWLGGAYGLGMAISYGILGLVVLAGGKFGTLNSSPWFNLAIAFLFVMLALAMFDVYTIDLTRFRKSRAGTREKRKGSAALAFFMGSVAALLAGACVAPVVLAVLLLASNMYAAGNYAGLIFPFLLGIGMALPWPFAGAGIGFLPKPGKWMTWVKYAFGIFIIAMAIYYGRIGISLLQQRSSDEEARMIARAQSEELEEGGWIASLSQALRKGLDEDKPVFIDFWATWCKNCLVMDKTTFKDLDVRAELDDFVKLKFQAEDFNDPATKEVLDYFGVQALPTYVMLIPKDR
ncbi:MAG: protein-disulfide reductase DsbD family protein [Candidatus Sumerlaeia bacterium]